MRRILHIVLITALMFLNVMYTCEAVKAAEPQQPISVEKAIQQKEGQALIEGYAVGQAVSPQHYKLTSPFSNDYNVALADRKNETSPDHILPVQIPSAFRSQFGLQTNPLLLGKKITVQGISRIKRGYGCHGDRENHVLPRAERNRSKPIRHQNQPVKPIPPRPQTLNNQ